MEALRSCPSFLPNLIRLLEHPPRVAVTTDASFGKCAPALLSLQLAPAVANVLKQALGIMVGRMSVVQCWTFATPFHNSGGTHQIGSCIEGPVVIAPVGFATALALHLLSQEQR